ncbi:hypothetical protein [Paenibacillus cremeus]|uniref:Uncharacterized protein n=1 Tax=Paenibacillus cremeus TaxID=2163881 RepID=A0A559KBD9_9BACL|nr:hypothetical protein [Paenibacillus cremeus]TVY09446.1 hypothetical protein FPZ49_13470 [Paenibacillus cremeus]
MSLTGIKIYVDVFYEPLGLALESEGFAVHAGNVTRDRFDFERMRMRTMAMYGYKYIPFTWDELSKKPEACRRTMYALLGRFSATPDTENNPLSVYERELLRYALRLHRSIRLSDVCSCLQLGSEASRRVLRNLVEKKLIQRLGTGKQRHHEYILGENVRDTLF